MIINSGYVLFNLSTGECYTPKGRMLYKCKKTAQNAFDRWSRVWGKSGLRVVKVNVVIDEQEG